MSASVSKFVDGFEIETDGFLAVGHNLFDTVRQHNDRVSLISSCR